MTKNHVHLLRGEAGGQLTVSASLTALPLVHWEESKMAVFCPGPVTRRAGPPRPICCTTRWTGHETVPHTGHSTIHGAVSSTPVWFYRHK